MTDPQTATAFVVLLQLVVDKLSHPPPVEHGARAVKRSKENLTTIV